MSPSFKWFLAFLVLALLGMYTVATFAEDAPVTADVNNTAAVIVVAINNRPYTLIVVSIVGTYAIVKVNDCAEEPGCVLLIKHEYDLHKVQVVDVTYDGVPI